MRDTARSEGLHGWRATLHEIIFEADTPAGKAFDVALIAAILTSVGVVVLESVQPVREAHGLLLRRVEWGFTVLFTVEYALRLLAVARPLKYARSFYGVVDLLAILPTYLDLLLPGGRVLVVVRSLRILRVFRIFKLAEYVGQAQVLRDALRASRYKITVFLVTVLSSVLIVGSLLYLVEGPSSGFTSIPTSVYWAVVTLTTVGYGDIAPQTPLGQALAACAMILGYGILAVPTGIVTVELANAARGKVSTQACPACGAEGHDVDARFCKWCGASLGRHIHPPEREIPVSREL